MSRVAGTQYSISSSTRKCAATGKDLLTGDRFVAALVQPPESDDFVRMDFCEVAWDAGARPDHTHLLLGVWRGNVPDPSAPKRLLIDDQGLLDLFERAELPETESNSEAQPAASAQRQRDGFRFVLALILLRKRLLIQEGSQGSTILVRPRGVPKPPEGPPLLEVLDPMLDDQVIADVTLKLSAVIAPLKDSPQ